MNNPRNLMAEPWHEYLGVAEPVGCVFPGVTQKLVGSFDDLLPEGLRDEEKEIVS